MRWFVVLLAACKFEHGTVYADASPDGTNRGDGTIVDTSNIDTPPLAPIMYVQGNVLANFGSNDIVSVGFSAPQVAGHFNIAVVSWSDGNDSVMSVTDSQANTYIAATSLVTTASFAQRIYYATNIKAGSNIVTARTTGNVPDPKLRIFEYAGIATTAPTDGSVAQSGVSNMATVGTVATTHANDLLFAANLVSSGTASPGPGYTQRQVDFGDLVQDRIVSATGSYTATSPINATANWTMQLVAFKGQ